MQHAVQGQSYKIGLFKEQLELYKDAIDQKIVAYAEQSVAVTGEHFGTYSAEAMTVFCDVLARGGKRIRGALTMLAYKMYGGTDTEVALQAALVMEIIQTYLLIVDDIYDRSDMRRGKASAHKMFEEMHKKRRWKDGAGHFGQSLAFNSALVSSHIAMVLAADLPVNDERRVAALRTLNMNLQITGEGQANDVFNEVTETDDKQRIDNVLEWKTAYYTFVNPLQFGAILAGADEVQLSHLRDFGLLAGRVFQITDDIVSTFGEEFESGKSPMDDIREGKRTLLTLYAMQHAEKQDAYHLQRMLGNHKLTQTEFDQCRKILTECGALGYAKEEALRSAQAAKKILSDYWVNNAAHDFLHGLLDYMLERRS